MKNRFKLLALVMLTVLYSCNHKITTSISKAYPTLDYKTDVTVFGLKEVVPEQSEIIGKVKLGDTGFSTKCGYEIALEKAKLEARKAGGNAIKITEHRLPSALGSTCHRINADILYIEGLENYEPKKEAEEVLLDVDYAILKVFRYKGYGALLNYNLRLGDSTLCRVQNNFKTTIQLTQEGLHTLWAKTETRAEVPIELIHGKTYYLRCSVKMGAFAGRPKLELVDSKTGKAEFESFEAKNQ